VEARPRRRRVCRARNGGLAMKGSDMHTPENGSPPRRRRRWVLGAALAVTALVTVAVPVAWATDIFADVPTASPHHDDINAVFGARITGGCATGPPALYCPSDPVRRDQMASFLRRGFGRAGSSGTTAGVVLTDTFQSIASRTMTSGGTTGGSGFVVLMGSATFDNASGNIVENNRIEFRLREVETGFTSNVSYTMLHAITDPLPSAIPSDSVMKQWQFSIPTGVTRTYSLDARVAFPSPPDGTVNALNRLMTVMYFPFGPSGTASPLGTAGEPGTPVGQSTPEN